MEEYKDFKIPAGSQGCPFVRGLGGMSLGEIKNIKVVFDNADGKEDRAIKDCPVVGFKFENENGFPPGSIVVKSETGTVSVGESNEEDIQKLFNGNYFYDEDDGFIYIDTNDDGLVIGISFVIK